MEGAEPGVRRSLQPLGNTQGSQVGVLSLSEDPQGPTGGAAGTALGHHGMWKLPLALQRAQRNERLSEVNISSEETGLD